MYIPYLIIATVALNILSFALPIVTLQVYDRVLPNPDSGTLPVLVAGVVVAVILEVLLRLARDWLVGWNGAVYEQKTACRAMDHVLASDIASTARLGTGEFLNRMAAIGKMKDFNNGYRQVTMVDLAFIPVFLGVIFYIAPPLAFMLVSILGIFAAVSVYQSRRLRLALEYRDRADDKRYDFLVECLKGVHTIKAFALEHLFARRYDELQEKSSIASLRLADASTSTFNAGSLMAQLMMVAVMAVGAFYAVNGAVTAGALIATLQLSGRLMQPVQRGLVLLAKREDHVVAERKVQSLFDLPRVGRGAVVDMPVPAGRLLVRHVAAGPLLRDINLDVAIGDTVVVTGADAAAKTELLEIMASLRPAEAGDVLVDGVDIHAFPPESLIRHIGYLPAEGTVFRGTIRDNMTGFGTLPVPSVRELARHLGVDRDVALLPAGFDTPLMAEGADLITPGLRQRIAMVRILAARPKIILFDEADRHLDRAGYNAVFALLSKLRRKAAMVIVSDDPNIASLATRRCMLQQGRLADAVSVLQ